MVMTTLHCKALWIEAHTHAENDRESLVWVWFRIYVGHYTGSNGLIAALREQRRAALSSRIEK